MRGLVAQYELKTPYCSGTPHPQTCLSTNNHGTLYSVGQQADGLLFDPWLRTHTSLGARILKVCPRSMTITAPVAAWEGWTDMRFPDSGQ